MTMKLNKTFAILILATLISTALVIAIEPTPQYSKIYLNPLYRPSIIANTNYNYTINVTAPDNIGQILNAMINFEAYISPTANFNLTVNNKSCNPSIFTISTTYMTSGLASIKYDCSNIINAEGQYNIILRTDKNSGAITSWLDLSYINNPKGQLNVFGTEYQVGDLGKMFLQFLDNNNNAVNNSECFLTLFYPNDTMLLNNSLMSKLNNLNEGIYYKNINIPNVTGVYPASAKCYLPATFNNIVNLSFAYDGFESGNFSGGTGGWGQCPVGSGANCTNGWDVEETVPLSTIVSNATAGCYRGLYCAKMTGSYGFIERGLQFPEGTSSVNISYAFKFNGFQNNEYMQFFIFDGNWHLLRNIGKLSQYGGYTNGIWYVINETLNETNYELGTIMIGWYATAQTPSTGDELYIDAVNVSILRANISLSNQTSYQILRGSGEIHVSDYASQLQTAINNITLNMNLDLNNLTQQILTNRNLSYAEYLNLTNQINSLQNNITLQYNNLTNQLSIIYTQTLNNSNKLDVLNNLSLYNNQIALQNQQILLELNNTLNYQFNITNTNINQALNNLSNQINILNQTITTQIINSQNLILSQINQSTTWILNEIQNQTINQNLQFQNLTNITMTNQNLLEQIWAYLSGFVTNTLLGLNQSVTQINNTVTTINNNVNILLNQTNTTLKPNSIIALTDSCITGSDWIIEATVLDQNNNNYQIANCTINTTAFGLGQMTYDTNTTTYIYRTTCPIPELWNWTITCI